jgi:hypothetical protein
VTGNKNKMRHPVRGSRTEDREGEGISRCRGTGFARQASRDQPEQGRRGFCLLCVNIKLKHELTLSKQALDRIPEE